jgi:transporter family protein
LAPESGSKALEALLLIFSDSMWVFFAVLSALFLGIYDIFKKTSLTHNAVLPVLFLSSLTSALIFLPLILVSRFSPGFAGHFFYVPEISWYQHGLIFIKTLIVASSWVLTYYAMKHLPVTIVSPIRSTGPVWTLIGAVIIFSEHLNLYQWTGISVSLFFFYLFTTAGRKEGITSGNRWLYFIIVGTLIGSASGLYDKYLIRHINNIAVQAWFAIYMIPVLLPLVYFIWFKRMDRTTAFEFRYSIPLIGISLTIADFCYFYALTDTNSLIAIISSLRRSSVIVTFIAGAILFHEKNITRKLLLLAGMMAGILVILWGSLNF